MEYEMNKKKYRCMNCGKIIIYRKLPHGWFPRTRNCKLIGYVCEKCKVQAHLTKFKNR